MYRKRGTVRAPGMDSQYSGNGTGRSKLSKMICILFLATLLHECTAYQSRHESIFVPNLQDPAPKSEPYFDASPANVTGLAGETIELPCKVNNRGNNTIAWMRHRDIMALTIGYRLVTNDQRFVVKHNPQTEEWTLRILYAKRDDTGVYECQIPTAPVHHSHIVYLSVIDPVTEIAGGPELFINKGSAINLTCYVREAPEPPSTVIWNHNHQAINFDSPRGGISLLTEKGPVTWSRLLIQKAIETDSGLYTCSPNNTRPASVRVHIVNEEHPAPVHHGGGDRTAAALLPVVLLLWMIV